MSISNTKKIHVLVRVTSSNQIRPDIEVACTLRSQPKRPLDSSYRCFREALKDSSGTKIAYLWMRVPSDPHHPTDCTVLHWCDADNASELLHEMEEDITAHVTEEVGKRYRIGKLSWDAGDERIGEWAHGYMHVRTNEDCEDDGAWDWEKHIWWDTANVEVPAS